MMETTDNHQKKNDLDDRKQRRKEEKEKLLKEVGHHIFTRHIDGNFHKYIEKTGLKPPNEKVGRLINENAAHVLKVVKKLVKIQKKWKRIQQKTHWEKVGSGKGKPKKP